MKNLNLESFDYWIKQGVKPLSYGNITPFEKIEIPKNEKTKKKSIKILNRLLQIGITPSSLLSIERLAQWVSADQVKIWRKN
jgi:hypothetical protein